MHLKIKNLGQIKQTDINVNDLTIICGPNGCNKTWLSYAIYHYFAFPKLAYGGVNFHTNDLKSITTDNDVTTDMQDEMFLNILVESFETYQQHCSNEIARTFNANENLFNHFQIEQLLADNEQSLTYLNAKNLQKNLINAKFDLSYKEFKIASAANDAQLTVTIKDGIISADKLTIALTVLLQHMISQLPLVHRPFAITSERVGCLAFQKDIDGTALRIKDTIDEILESPQFSQNPQLQEAISRLQMQTFGNRSNLATPVRANLRAVREAEQEFKKQSFLQQAHPEINSALRQITQGSFASDNGVLQYQFDDSQQMPITVASSSIKSLFHFDLYINHLAKKGDVLLIDEPELNLHPDNQRQMAKVIARLANAGIKVLITTHSDYLIREINNSIMLSHDVENKAEIMERNQLQECDILTGEKVSAYSIDSQGICTQLDINHMGIDTQIFDSIIADTNELQNEIYYNLNDGL